MNGLGEGFLFILAITCEMEELAKIHVIKAGKARGGYVCFGKFCKKARKQRSPVMEGYGCFEVFWRNTRN